MGRPRREREGRPAHAGGRTATSRTPPLPVTPPLVAHPDAAAEFLGALGHGRLLIMNQRRADATKPLWLDDAAW